MEDRMTLEESLKEARDGWLERSRNHQLRNEKIKERLHSVIPAVAKGFLIATLAASTGLGVIIGADYVSDQAVAWIQDTQSPDAQSADAPAPSRTPIASQEPVPTQEIEPTPETMQEPGYKMISLGEVSSFTSPETNLGLPPGENILEGIPFDTGWTTTTACRYNPNMPTKYTIDADVSDISFVYFLIQAGDGTHQYAGQQVGTINLNFASGETLVQRLVLGETIRDWSTVHADAVKELSSENAYEGYRGSHPNGLEGRMDILRVDIPDGAAFDGLMNIVLEDTSQETTGSLDPCVHLLAVTAQTEEPSYTEPLWLYSGIVDSASTEFRVDAGWTFYLSTGYFDIGDHKCTQADDRVCVYIREVNADEHFTVSGMPPGNAWWGVTHMGVDETLRDREPLFWEPPNCTVGCNEAYVVVERDGDVNNFLIYKGADQ